MCEGNDLVKTKRAVLVVALASVLLLASCSTDEAADGTPSATAAPAVVVNLNQMQVIGSHNSYHVEQPADVLAGYASAVPSAVELSYGHEPLAEQFSNQGVRQIELDIYADPNGDLWRPIGTTGYKVLHIEQIDELSTCEVFVACLEQVKAWSDANPTHLPIAILVEVKDTVDFPVPPDPLPVGSAELMALDDEIRSVFAPDDLITPDDVRGERATLEQAVLTDGWPSLVDIQGRVMFLLDNKRDEYVANDPTLAGRVIFPPSEPGLPDAAFIKRNDPEGENLAQIQELVRAGYVVRTRADGPVLTPRDEGTAQLEAALASGAQWVSTDYPVPGLASRWGDGTYVAAIPGGMPARCNPINAPEGCTEAVLAQLGT